MHASRRWPAGLLLCGLIAACHSTNVPPITASGFRPAADEQPLWDSSEKIHQYLSKNGLVVEDIDAQAMMEEIAARLLPAFKLPEGAVRIYIVRDPFLNAFALPDGRVYLHTGILSRIANRDQAATLLGHEITHYVGRHSLREARTAKNQQAIYRTAAVLVAIAAAGFTGDANMAQMILQLGGDLGDNLARAQVAGYSRDLEREADRSGFEAMLAAGYDPREALRFFEVLKEHDDETIAEPFFFGSHPRIQERLDNTAELLAAIQLPLGPPPVDREYNLAVAKLRLVNADLDLRIGRVQHARQGIERHLEFAPDSPTGLFAMGEFYRRYDTSTEAPALALDSYLAAIAADPDFAPAHREAGLLERENRRCEQADFHLHRYIENAPRARDRGIVAGFIGDCGATDAGGEQ